MLNVGRKRLSLYRCASSLDAVRPPPIASARAARRADFLSPVFSERVRQRRTWTASGLQLNDIFETKRRPRDLSIRKKFVFSLRNPRATGGG
jgi:hypothetical protein